MKNRRQLLTDAMQQSKIEKGFGYFLKLSGNPKMKDVPGKISETWRVFLTKIKNNEK